MVSNNNSINELKGRLRKNISEYVGNWQNDLFFPLNDIIAMGEIVELTDKESDFDRCIELFNADESLHVVLKYCSDKNNKYRVTMNDYNCHKEYTLDLSNNRIKMHAQSVINEELEIKDYDLNWAVYTKTVELKKFYHGKARTDANLRSTSNINIEERHIGLEKNKFQIIKEVSPEYNEFLQSVNNFLDLKKEELITTK